MLVQLPSGIYVFAQGDSSGNLLVNVAAGGAGGGNVNLFDAVGNPIYSTAGALNIAGSIAVTPSTSSTAGAVNQATVNTGSAQALAASATRTGFAFTNGGTTTLYVLQGAGSAGPTNFTVALQRGEQWFGIPGMVWLGAVQWASSANGGSGTAQNFTP